MQPPRESERRDEQKHFDLAAPDLDQALAKIDLKAGPDVGPLPGPLGGQTGVDEMRAWVADPASWNMRSQGDARSRAAPARAPTCVNARPSTFSLGGVEIVTAAVGVRRRGLTLGYDQSHNIGKAVLTGGDTLF
jgi:hypothetical protein